MEVPNGIEMSKTMQCINCGYASSDLFVGNKETNESYKSLSDDMKRWSKETEDRIWIPSMITLPTGMLFPIDVDNLVNHGIEMKWAFANMEKISEDDQGDYPVEGIEGKFYEKRYNTDNPIIYDTFLEALSDINESAKKVKVEAISSINLPKLKKIDG